MTEASGAASIRVLSESRGLPQVGVSPVKMGGVRKRVGWGQLGPSGEPAWGDEGPGGAVRTRQGTFQDTHPQGGSGAEEPSFSPQQSPVGRCPVGWWACGVSPPGTQAGGRRVQSGREGREPGLQGLHAECEPALTQRTGLEVVSAL